MGGDVDNALDVVTFVKLGICSILGSSGGALFFCTKVNALCSDRCLRWPKDLVSEAAAA